LQAIGGEEYIRNEKSSKQLFALRALTSGESASSIWKREMEEVRKEMVLVRPGLWNPKHALVSHDSPQREVAILTQEKPQSSKPSAVFAQSAPAQLSVPKTKEKSVAQPRAKPVTKKFEVPLDKLDEPHSNSKQDEVEDEKMSVEKENVELEQSAAAPEVALTISSASSPSAKRQRFEEVESVASSSEPQFRQVTIKKKVVVTEYEMGPNGEMMVKDVEKMVEETKLEPVPPASGRSSINVRPTEKKKDAKATPGQGKLTSFFKKN
jgi:hypothetical protein